MLRLGFAWRRVRLRDRGGRLRDLPARRGVVSVRLMLVTEIIGLYVTVLVTYRSFAARGRTVVDADVVLADGG